MKKIFGFIDEIKNTENTDEVISATDVEAKEPFKCLVQVHFQDIAKDYSYYNDSFYLEVGDTVFVSGKLYGKPGTVTNVNRCFRINIADYKKVIAKPDMKINGKFISFHDKMVSFDTNLTVEQFKDMIIAPPDPDEYEDEDDEIIYGEGWTVELADFENHPQVNNTKLERAVEICCNGEVVFLSLRGNKGTAFIKGRSWYTVEFEFDGETVSNIYCDCPYPDPCLCKHELAMLITLRLLVNADELSDKGNDFVALDKNYFWNHALSNNIEVVLK